MNIYKVTNPKWHETGSYDRFDSFVVIAENEADAISRIIERHGTNDYNYPVNESGKYMRVLPEGWNENQSSIIFECIGQSFEHLKPEIVCASFNAG